MSNGNPFSKYLATGGLALALSFLFYKWRINCTKSSLFMTESMTDQNADQISELKEAIGEAGNPQLRSQSESAEHHDYIESTIQSPTVVQSTDFVPTTMLPSAPDDNSVYAQDKGLAVLHAYPTEYVDFCHMEDNPGPELEEENFEYYQSDESYLVLPQPQPKCTCVPLPVVSPVVLPSQIVSPLQPSPLLTDTDAALVTSFGSMSLVPSNLTPVSFYNQQRSDIRVDPTDAIRVRTDAYDIRVDPTDAMRADAYALEQQQGEEGQEVWTFEFPQDLCGRLIGKGGRNINSINEHTGADVVLLNSAGNTAGNAAGNTSTRLLKVSGFKSRVMEAITIIEGRFPGLHLRRLSNIKAVPVLPFKDEHVQVSQLQLPDNEGTNCIISSIIDGGQFYVQVVIAATQTLLSTLHMEMNHCYDPSGQGRRIPGLSWIPVVGTYCAVQSDGDWFRAQVVHVNQMTKEVEILYVDYGFCETVKFVCLRQLRSDLFQMPFQAIQCYMANVVPNINEMTYSVQAAALLEKLTEGTVLKVYVKSFRNGIPCVELYLDRDSSAPLLVNREMVNNGVARWSEV